MTEQYNKPTIMVNDEIAEGVYAASGCYTVSARIHQVPQTGRGDYRIQVDGHHNADHTSDSQTLTISFNQPVTYGGSNGTLLSGNGTSTLMIGLGYHQNPTDNIGMGDLIVTSDAGLAITGVSLSD